MCRVGGSTGLRTFTKVFQSIFICREKRIGITRIRVDIRNFARRSPPFCQIVERPHQRWARRQVTRAVDRRSPILRRRRLTQSGFIFDKIVVSDPRPSSFHIRGQTLPNLATVQRTLPFLLYHPEGVRELAEF